MFFQPIQELNGRTSYTMKHNLGRIAAIVLAIFMLIPASLVGCRRSPGNNCGNNCAFTVLGDNTWRVIDSDSNVFFTFNPKSPVRGLVRISPCSASWFAAFG